MKKQQNEIEKLSKLRYKYIDQQNDTCNKDKGCYGINNDKIVDELGDKILSLIKQHKEILSFEFIIYELTNLGWAPNLLYDDNGHFALVGTGFQSISIEKDDATIYNFVEKEQWKDTIREALYNYLDS